jgi:hypothetical protein
MDDSMMLNHEPPRAESRAARKSPYRFFAFLPSLLLVILFLQPQKLLRQVDVPQYFAVGHIVNDGKIAQLYDHDSYKDFVALAGRGALYYNRPAFHALALWPFAYMSYGSFLLIVRILSYVVFGLALWLVPRWFPGKAQGRALLLCFQPFMWTLALGQDTIILTLLIGYGTHLLLHRERDFQGGAILALGLFKPHVVWAIPIALAAQRKWRALTGFVAVGSFLAVLSFSLIGFHGVQQWIAVLKAPTTDVSAEYMGNAREIAEKAGLAASVAFAGIALACFGACSRRSLSTALAAALFVSPMLVPHSYLQDYSPTAVSALIVPTPVLTYLVLVPWQYVWPGEATGMPYAICGIVFLFLLACWPAISRLFRNPHLSLRGTATPRRANANTGKDAIPQSENGEPIGPRRAFTVQQ